MARLGRHSKAYANPDHGVDNLQCEHEGSWQIHSSQGSTAFIDDQEMSENVVITWDINQ